MAAAEALCKDLNAFHELSFLNNIYKTKEELHEKLSEHGLEIYKHIDVPKVQCFMYVPASFPKTCEEAEEFDFELHADKRLTVGVCIGGTWLCTGWDEKSKLGLQGILGINHNCSSADRAATQIFLALDDFLRDHTELARHNINLDVHICGYSLGGLFAQVTTVLLQDWANTTGSIVTCRTYESPGVPEMYHAISRNFDDNAEAYWKQRITNYKSLPNPLNTVFADVGRVFHLKNTDHICCTWSWIGKCIAGSAKRIVFWTSLLRSFGVSNLEGVFDTLSQSNQRRLIGAAVAVELGMDVAEIVRTHDVALMLTCFDATTGALLPDACLEMEAWPIYELFEDSAIKLLQNIPRGLVLMDPGNAGLHTMFLFGGRRGFVERKLASIPGYRPLTEKAPQSAPIEVSAE